MDTFKRVYLSPALGKRPMLAQVKETGSITCRDDATGQPVSVPTFSVIVDGKLHLADVAYQTARFNAQCVVGVLK